MKRVIRCAVDCCTLQQLWQKCQPQAALIDFLQIASHAAADQQVHYLVEDEGILASALVRLGHPCQIQWLMAAEDADLALLLFFCELYAREGGARQIRCAASMPAYSQFWGAALQARLRPYLAGKVLPPLSQTETVNAQTVDLDRVSVRQALKMMSREDQSVAPTVAGHLDAIADFIEALVERMRQGGRLLYVGAGSSGRLGVLDASECPPTFGSLPGQVVGLVAGGAPALQGPVEGAEDDQQAGAQDLLRCGLQGLDAVVGIAASGNTPYVCGALRYAGQQGSLTAALSSNPCGRILPLAMHRLAIPTGPEVVSGSTRLKSGTMQKLVLNMISTVAMVQLGKVYGNLMVDVEAANQKLVCRAHYLVQKSLGCSYQDAHRLLEQSGMSVKTALVMGLLSVDASTAEQYLQAAGGKIRAVLP